jgi:hypothetical protein
MPHRAAAQEIETGRHVARTFQAVPGIAQARQLFDAIADATPDLPPVPWDMPLALYGGGNLGRMARDFLHAVWLDVDFVVDRNADALRENIEWQGITIYHPDDVPEALMKSHLLLVSVVLAPYVPLEAALGDFGFRHVVPFYDFAENFRHIHPLSNGWYARPFDSVDRAMTVNALDGWSDDISRAHHLAFLAWRRLRQEWTFQPAPVTTGDRFFVPQILAALTNHDVFLDAGAHHGSVTEKFDKLTHGQWSRIVCVEPDAINAGILATTIANGWPEDAAQRPEILPVVLGAGGGTALFRGGLGYASQVSALGDEEFEVEAIDNLGIDPTFIKLHLEGYELEALKGARQTLLTRRPIVVATVYHNDDGTWRTPLWLMKTLVDYHLMFRIHSWCGTSAVIYAIPKERLS